MTWLNIPGSSAPEFERVLGLRPELLDLYKRFYGALWDEQLLPPRLLELCRLRIASLHDCAAELAIHDPAAAVSPVDALALGSWQTARGFSPAERAALTVAEKMPWQHHGISDSEMGAIREHLGDSGLVALMVALALFDANCRMRLALDVQPPDAQVASAPSGSAPLY